MDAATGKRVGLGFLKGESGAFVLPANVDLVDLLEHRRLGRTPRREPCALGRLDHPRAAGVLSAGDEQRRLGRGDRATVAAARPSTSRALRRVLPCRGPLAPT